MLFFNKLKLCKKVFLKMKYVFEIITVFNVKIKRINFRKMCNAFSQVPIIFIIFKVYPQKYFQNTNQVYQNQLIVQY